METLLQHLINEIAWCKEQPESDYIKDRIQWGEEMLTRCKTSDEIRVWDVTTSKHGTITFSDLRHLMLSTHRYLEEMEDGAVIIVTAKTMTGEAYGQLPVDDTGVDD